MRYIFCPYLKVLSKTTTIKNKKYGLSYKKKVGKRMPGEAIVLNSSLGF